MAYEAKHGKHSKQKTPKAKGNNPIGVFFGKIRNWFSGLSKGKKTLVITLCSIILVLAILIGIVVGVLSDLLKDYNHNELDDPDINNIQQIDDQILNIALFGIDSRSQSFEGLSDSIMVLSINTKTKDIKLISIMRDTLAQFPEHQGKKYNPAKINSAYQKGGPALAIKTLNHNFGLDIKEYATVNFFGMTEIIDAVGGIEIDVLKREIKHLNRSVQEQADILKIDGKQHYVKEAGKQLLTGIQAVSWARIRYTSTADGTSNDYGRTDRQRVVMEQLLNKALSTDVSKYSGIIKAILPHMETSLSFNEVLSLGTHVLGGKVQFQQTRVPQKDYVISDSFVISGGGMVVYYDLDYAAKIIHSIIYGDLTQDEYIKQNGVEKKDWYGAGQSTTSSNGSSSKNSSTTNSSASSVTTNTSSNSSVNTSSETTTSETTSSENTSSETTTSENSSNENSSNENSSAESSSSEDASTDNGGTETTVTQ
jgi:LCP family protein required for cell wall assembly